MGKKDKEGGSLLENLGANLKKKVEPNKSICPSLSLRTRVKGWAICLCLGFVISMMSSGMIKSIANGKVLKFGVIYTLGTLVALSSSMFLWGPRAQCKAMFDKTRMLTTIVYLSCIAAIITCLVLTALEYAVPWQLILVLILC